MIGNNNSFPFVLTLLTAVVLLAPSVATAQGDNNQLANATAPANTTEKSIAPTPVFSEYRGVNIGMTATSVRAKMDHLKEKSATQDFFLFSDQESAQVYYDNEGKVMAISVDYFGKESNPPTAKAVLGEDLQAKADGSMYMLKRYPQAGYWVSYNRTAGDEPHVSITIQRSSP